MAKKDLFHTRKKCGGKFNIEYNDKNIPFLVCELCGDKVNDWEKWFDQYHLFWQDQEKWKDKKNHIVCILGYFTHLYKNFYNIDFTFSLNENGLFRGQETVQIRKFYKMLNDNAALCKKYLEWIFNIKLKGTKKKITTLGFLATPSVVNEFKFYMQDSQKVNRTTPLPEIIIKWVDKNMPEITQIISLKDHGDLNLLLTHYKNGNLKDNPYISNFINKLININYVGADFKIVNWSE